jgi:molybdopterin-synthase adenylyltransferase
MKALKGNTLRYSRQIILEEFGIEAQGKLENARALVIGAGGLGSPILLYLAAAGVGTLGIADFDTVALSNLNRQVIHFTEDVGSKKIDSAERKIKQLNPEITVEKFKRRIDANNIEDLIAQYDLVVDATDNFSSRYLISDCCFLLGKPLVEGAAVGYVGILMTIIPGQTPCYRCLYPEPPADGEVETCSDVGILGAVTGVIGSLQAMEAIKVITGIGEIMAGRVLFYDAISAEFTELKLNQSEDCALCGKWPTITELHEYVIHCKTKEV